MHRIPVLLISCLLFPVLAAAQAPPRIAIRAGRLIDARSEKPLENPLIQVEGDKIVSVTAGGSAPTGVEVIDLGSATVLPGFIDVHTHLLLQGDVTSEEYDAQLLKESIPYRAILAARNAQIGLSHGFTAMRTLPTYSPRPTVLPQPELLPDWSGAVTCCWSKVRAESRWNVLSSASVDARERVSNVRTRLPSSRSRRSEPGRRHPRLR